MWKNRLKLWLQNFVILFFAVTLISLFIEVILRKYNPQNGHFYKSDPILGARLIPYQKGIWKIEGKQESIEINQFGFRGWDYSLEKPNGVIRIAVIGDSYVEALQVAEAKTFTSLLESSLNKNSENKYEVLSFGVSGYGTVQEYLLFNEAVKKFNPDIIILAFTSGNDVRNNIFALEQEIQKPYLILQKGNLELQKPIITGGIIKTINQQLLRRSHLYRFAIVRLVRLPLFQKAMTKEGIPIDYFIYSCKYNNVWDEAWNTTQAILKRFNNEVEKNGAKFVLVNLTTYFQIHEEKGLDEVLDKYPAMRDQCWDIQRPNQILREFASKEKIIYLDLLPDFIKEYKKSGRESHLLTDGHWNEYGHALAAKILSEFLKSKERTYLSN